MSVPRYSHFVGLPSLSSSTIRPLFWLPTIVLPLRSRTADVAYWKLARPAGLAGIEVELGDAVHQRAEDLAARQHIHRRVVVHAVAADAVRLGDRPLAIDLQELLILREQHVLAVLQPRAGDDVVFVAEEGEDLLLAGLVAAFPFDDLVAADRPGDCRSASGRRSPAG